MNAYVYTPNTCVFWRTHHHHSLIRELGGHFGQIPFPLFNILVNEQIYKGEEEVPPRHLWVWWVWAWAWVLELVFEFEFAVKKAL
jgi:hypothetical protein